MKDEGQTSNGIFLQRDRRALGAAHGCREPSSLAVKHAERAPLRRQAALGTIQKGLLGPE